MTIVAFDYPTWVARFPEFSSVSAALAQMYFAEACMLCDNTDYSPVEDIPQRTLFLNYLTAHIAKLNATVNGVAPSGLVGRIASAAEGSVNVSLDAGTTGNTTEAYYMQTPYGMAYWNLTAGYRLGKYYVGPQPFTERGPVPGGFPWNRSW